MSICSEDGVLTIKADFAEKISGLTIGDRRGDDTIYRLRYLDSSQFAWLADTFWYDYGWMELGDVERYYSEEELEWDSSLFPLRNPLVKAEPAPAERRTRKVLHQVRQTVLISFGLMNYEKEKCV